MIKLVTLDLIIGLCYVGGLPGEAFTLLDVRAEANRGRANLIRVVIEDL